MVSGRTWPDGDPFLQKQDEGSIAVSSRNVLHLVGGANDYRTVDLPGLPTDKPTGDAWVGLFKSFDGGKTWKSTLIPGYPQDNSAAGLSSPLKGFSAAADPLVRAGSNGLFFYSAIAFQRAAIVGSTPVRAGIEDNNGKDATGSSRAVSRKRERERARAREKAREREREKAREREREWERTRARTSQRLKGKGSSTDRKNEPRQQPDPRIRGGAEDDDEEAGVDGTASSVFVSTLIDLNNRENGDPISFVRTTLVDHDSGVRFLDKSWMAVDVPRDGSQMCVLDAPQDNGEVARQSFPGGRVYVVYTAFTGSGATQKGQILFAYSSDCGATWSAPRDISTIPDPDITDDGIVNINDVNVVRASFGKRCGDVGFNPAADTNGDCIVNVLDLTYVSRFVGRAFPATARRIPQGATIAINPLTGAVYVAWREFKSATQPDAIQVVRSTDFGLTFSTPRTISLISPFDQGTTETSFRTSAFPTLAADGARVYAAWAARGFATQQSDPLDGDARIVMATSVDGLTCTAPRAVDEGGTPGHQIMPALAFGAGKLSLLYYDLREDMSHLFGPFIDEFSILNSKPVGVRHTLDPRIAQADPGVAPAFTSVRLASYSFGTLPGSEGVQQLQFNPPNLKIARFGTVPFMGDYLDIAASPTIRANADGTWAFNIEPQSSSAGHAIWTDNRDVRAGPGGDLSNYTPPNSPSRHATSLFDSSQALPACNPDYTGTRDQNVYTARFDQGLFAAALGNSKPLGALQRAFALFVENASTTARSYRLSIVEQPAGGQATFDQFSPPQSPVTQLDVSIPRRSTVARSGYVSSGVPQARVIVHVDEIAAPFALDLVPGGLHGAITLNGDPSAPAIENPAIENPAIENHDINAVEVYTPLLSTAVASPAIENPAIENPAIENPAIENVAAANPSIIHPAIENTVPAAPAIENPAIENPAIENTDLVNGSISDTTWDLVNAGNTAAAYAVKLLLNSPRPPGFKTQLIIHKTYTTLAADGCALKSQLHNVVLANITSPQFADPNSAGDPAIENPAIENASVALAPGETASVTFRVFDPDKNDAVKFDTVSAVTPVAVSQSVNSEDALNGVVNPPVAIAMTILTPFLPDAIVGVAYSQQLLANLPGQWSLADGTVLPAGLVLDAGTGAISGTPTVGGSVSFIIELVTFESTPRTVRRQFQINSGGQLTVLTASLPDAVLDAPYSATVLASGGFGARTWSIVQGTLPTGLALSPTTGVISGTPTVAGPVAFRVGVHDSSNPQQTTEQPLSIAVGAAGPDVSIELISDTNPIGIGATLTYTATVRNVDPGSTASATGVVATVSLPAGATFLSATSAQGVCDRAGTLVTCSLNDIPDNSDATVQVQVRPEVGSVTLVASADVVSTLDPSAVNNHVSNLTGTSGGGVRRVWVANSGAAAPITRVNPDTNSSIGTLPIVGAAGDVAFSPDGTRAYVADFSLEAVNVYDAATESAVTGFGVTQPVRLEVDPTSARLYVTQSIGIVTVFDTGTNGQVDTFAVGTAHGGLAIAPDGKHVYIANTGSDNVSIFDVVAHTVTNVSVGAFPADVAVSPNGKQVWVTNYFDSSISVIDTASNTVIDTIFTNLGPQGITFSPDGSTVYVANFDNDLVSVINAASRAEITSVIVLGSPNGIVASPDGTAVYVTAYNDGFLRVIDTASNTVITSISAGALPIAVDYARIRP